MAEGKRPGGLTALAVLNFVFGGLGVIGLLGAFALIGIAQEGLDAVEKAGGTVEYDGPGMGSIYFSLLLSTVSVTLLIASGVGYIKQKEFLGRKLGTAYACVSIGSSIVSIALLSSGFGVFTLIGLVYPALTLILLNTTFKDDFYA